MPDITPHTLAIVFGITGLACQLGWPLLRNKRDILIVQLGSSIGFGTQYALFGATSAAAFCTLGAIQTLAVLWLPNSSRMISYGAIAIVIPLTAITWAGPASALAFVAVTLVLISRLQATTLRLRGLQLASGPFVMGHDLLTGAYPALLASAIGAGIALVGIAREIRETRGHLAPAGLAMAA